MPTDTPVEVDARKARAFLRERLRIDASEVVPVGEGAWSRCFGFRHGDEELVIRFGQHLDDFLKDRHAWRYATPGLPIPEVLDVGQAFDGYFAISTRAYGVPLESLGAEGWLAVVPAVAAALEAMRRADLASGSGVGSWGGDGKAPHAGWSGHLLAAGDDPPQRRTHGWRARLSASGRNATEFAWGFELLEELASDAVTPSLVHGDLLNRNVLASAGRLSAVFDWGCALFGDHLYDLAWFEFWAPWHPELDMGSLRSEMERRWHEAGYVPEDREVRLLACHLHIGLDHLAYNAWLGDWPAFEATAERMRVLARKG